MVKETTLEEFRRVLHYDPATGIFTWLVDSGRAHAGASAGSVNRRDGYVIINYCRTWHRAHRLAWFMMTGGWPILVIDHINGDRSDNRWSNLREATPMQNCANSARPVTNTSGFKGVYYSKHAHRWRAQISLGNKTKNLGYFDTPEAAHEAYLAAASAAFGEFARAA